jgi:hypothetical protein
MARLFRSLIVTIAERSEDHGVPAGEAGKPVVVVMATMHGEEDFGQPTADLVRSLSGRRG